MKKLVLSLAICIMTVMCLATTSFAADTILESPNVKIVIDGKTGSYEDVPLIINGRTMLPLRALLVNLGVQNDNEHIIWNDSEKSITIIKEDKKIELKIDNKTATVNNSPVNLDAAPVLYKSKTYIPAKFVAQSLGKKVVWDGSTSTVLIRDEAEFNKVKAILDKSNEATKAINKFKYTADAVVTINNEGKDIKSNVIANSEFDKQSKLLHSITETEVMGSKIKMEMYIGSDALYMKDSQTNKWQKMKLEGDLLEKAFEDSGSAALMEYTEAMCAGLVLDNSASNGDIVLKGDIYLEDLFKATGMKTEGVQIDFNKMYVEMTLDKNTYLTKKAYMDIAITMKVMGQSQKLSEAINCTYSDYNGNFQLAIPEEAKKAETLGQ